MLFRSKQQLELDMEQRPGFKLGKEYIKAAYCHPAYLTYMQSTSCKMPDWMKQKLESRMPDHLTCLLRSLYAGQEATIRAGHGTMDWFQIRKGVRQGCILSPCLFNLYAEYIMRNAGLDEAQVGIKIARRNIKTQDMQMTPPL